LYYIVDILKKVLYGLNPAPRLNIKQRNFLVAQKRQFVIFNKDSPEVYSTPKFLEYIQKKIGDRFTGISTKNIIASPLLDSNNK
jgi:hypothetical protein